MNWNITPLCNEQLKINKIKEVIEAPMAQLGYRLVQTRYVTGENPPILQIMAERSSDGEMPVSACAELSRELSTLLDIEDPIGVPYMLEVSSPGIDRPLTSRADFRKFLGFEANIELINANHGRRHYSGRLTEIYDDKIVLKIGAHANTSRITFSFDDIKNAKLKISEDLMRTNKIKKAV